MNKLSEILRKLKRADLDLEEKDLESIKTTDWDEMMDRLNNRPWYTKVWWWICRGKRNITSDFYYWLKRKWFQLWHGFDYKDTWGLDYSCAKWILPRLKHLKKIAHGFPAELSTHWDSKNETMIDDHDIGDEGFEKWMEILDKMIFAFEIAIQNGDGLELPTDEEWKKTKEGLKLFAYWYFGLWD